MGMMDSQQASHVESLVQIYGDLLFRVCYVIVCNEADAQDAVQETFIRYLTKAPAFQNENHEKAWLIKVAANISKNIVKARRGHRLVSAAELREIGIAQQDMDTFTAILDLPVKYKSVLHLYYICGYKSHEIAEMIGISPAAVRKRLQHGRALLRQSMERGSSS